MPQYSCTESTKDWVVKVYVREGEGIEKSQKYTEELKSSFLFKSLYIKEKIS